MKFKTKIPVLLIAGTALVPMSVNAQNVAFDVKTLQSLGYTRDVADFFSKEARFLPGENTVTIKVNGSHIYFVNARFNTDGELCIDNTLLGALKLRQHKQVGECTNITTLWPEAQVKLFPGQFRLELTVPEDALDPEKGDYLRGGYAVMLNYNMFGQQIKSPGNEINFFQGFLEPGFNLYNWVVRNRSTVTSGLGGETLRSEETAALRAIESMKSILQVGQFGAQSEVFSGLPLTGAQLYSDGAQSQAARLLIPIQGVAETNATVEIKQRGRVIYRTMVPAGPFTLDSIRGLSSGVPIEVNVIEEDGRQQHFTLTNTVDAAALQATNSYQFGLGKYRPYVGADQNRQTPWVAMVEGSFSRDGNKSLTTAGLVAENYQNVAVRSTYTGSKRGWLSGGVNVGRTQGDKQGLQTDIQSQIALGGNVSASLSTLYRSADYLTADEALENNEALQVADRNPLSTSASASLNWGDMRWGNYAYTFTQNNYHRGGSDHVHMLSTGQRLGNASMNLTLQSSSNGEQSVYAGLSLPLGGGTLSARYQNIAGSSALGTSYRNSLGSNGSYSIGASGSQQQQRTNAAVNMRTPYAQLGGAVSQSTTQSRSVSASASGGIALANGTLATTSQAIGDTFAVVNIPEQGNLRIQAPGSGNTLTNQAGSAILPKIQPYTKSMMKVDSKSLPLNLRLDSTTANFELALGTVASQNIGATQVKQLLLTIKNANGEAIPQGSSVLDEKGNFISSVVGDGNIMLTNNLIGMPLRVKITNASECTVDYHAPETFAADALYEEADALCR
ncbi:TPA: fimbria/pilus outer membrane usher protein [Serratia fonticola]|nr:fimbria/pilus outer membrane usher protein [Serratia fonticola]